MKRTSILVHIDVTDEVWAEWQNIIDFPGAASRGPDPSVDPPETRADTMRQRWMWAIEDAIKQDLWFRVAESCTVYTHAIVGDAVLQPVEGEGL